MVKTYVQATLGVGSVNFRAVDFGGALFNWFNWFFCVLPVLSDTWGLRCTMFIFWVKEADWGMIAFSPILPLGFQNLKPCVSACPTHSVAPGHHPCPGLVLSISGHLPLLGQGVRACACVCVRACVRVCVSEIRTIIFCKNHLEERLLDQAQARASYTPLFWGRSRSIPQCMASNV